MHALLLFESHSFYESYSLRTNFSCWAEMKRLDALFHNRKIDSIYRNKRQAMFCTPYLQVEFNPNETAAAATVADFLLLALNAWHVYTAICIMVPVEAIYKKFIVDIQYEVASRLHNIPLFNVTVVSSLVLLIRLRYSESTNKGDYHLMNRFYWSACTLLCQLIVHKFSTELVAVGPKGVLDRAHELERQNILEYQPPSASLLRWIFLPMDAIFPSDLTGIQNVTPATPSLFVVNHTLYGLEIGTLINQLYQEKGVFLRGLADHIHFGFPQHAAMRFMGAVDGTRPNVDTLMEGKQHVMVYPGGQREVLKHSSIPKYTLLWGERLGFAKMAIKHGYPILPVAVVGPEDMFDILIDMPLFGFGITFPIPKPFSPFRLQKIYFWFGEPIPTVSV